MNMIKRPITEDKMVGYDEYNQLCLSYREREDRDWITTIFISDVRNKICAICQHGWESNSISMKNQSRWRLINETVHETCLVRHHSFIERAELENILVDAGIRFLGLKPIENRYWPKTCEESKKPWYEARLMEYPGKFIIGWRKRVINIEFSPHEEYDTTMPDAKFYEGIFAAEGVTKEFKNNHLLIHAWDCKKATEYCKKIYDSLPRKQYELRK